MWHGGGVLLKLNLAREPDVGLVLDSFGPTLPLRYLRRHLKQ